MSIASQISDCNLRLLGISIILTTLTDEISFKAVVRENSVLPALTLFARFSTDDDNVTILILRLFRSFVCVDLARALEL